jgi:hypothetical protein
MHSVSSQNPIILTFGALLFKTGIYLQLFPKKPMAPDLYSSRTIICLIKTTIMTCVRQVARRGDRRVAHRDLLEKCEGEKHLEGLAVDGIMLKCFFKSVIRE